MYAVRIEHTVADFEAWKKVFDSDPIGREKSGVRRYRILRPVDDAKRVMIDLETGSEEEARSLLSALRTLWGRVEGGIMTNPQARIVAVVEAKDYRP